MLLRQLLRPSTRSVAAAAAWRSAPTAQLLHSSTRLLQEEDPSSTPPSSSPSASSSTTPPSQHNDQNDNGTPQPADQSPSLFERLFPDEARQARAKPDGKSFWSPGFEAEPPPLEVSSLEDLLRDDILNDKAKLDAASTSSGPPDAADAEPVRANTMLILSAASRQLTESDFLRLGRQGAHVEGWVGGVSRVIQARDPDTLQPQGHYFLLFESRAAAVAYREEFVRLWELGKAYVPGAHHGRGASADRRMPAPPGLLGPDGRDVAADLRSFTLVPPSQRYYLQLSSAHGREHVESLHVGGGGFVDRLAARAGSRHLVLVAVDGGRISVETLRQAIEEDGADRNLPWRVTDLENGILPFGKSVLKRHDQDARMYEASFASQDGGGGEEGKDPGEAGGVDEKKYRRYPRFIVPFTDEAEAHRFVRRWHRRQFKLQMSHTLGGQSEWEESRILNASVLW